MNWLNSLKARVLLDEPLAGHTTFRLGARAGYWVEPDDIGSLKLLLEGIKKERSNYLVIGAGSNLLIRNDVPFVVRLIRGGFGKISVRGTEVTAGAGVSLSRLLRETAAFGLGGLEFLAGIPGTVGGALVMNAGTLWPQRNEIGALAGSVSAIDSSCRIRDLGRKDLRFAYRLSNLSGLVVASVRLRLKNKPALKIRESARNFMDYRRNSQDLKGWSAGCIFKNPPGDSAGRLIDLCGLKGFSVAGAVVSSKHANFIINRAGATAEDVYKLMGIIQKEVKKKFNIVLEPEIKII